MFIVNQGSWWSWSFGCWTCTYLCNQYLLPLKCEFELRSWRGVFDTTLCDKRLPVTFDTYKNWLVTNKKLEKTEWAINNGQSRETINIVYTDTRRWQTKQNTCVVHHYAQRNTNNVIKILALIQNNWRYKQRISNTCKYWLCKWIVIIYRNYHS